MWLLLIELIHADYISSSDYWPTPFYLSKIHFNILPSLPRFPRYCHSYQVL